MNKGEIALQQRLNDYLHFVIDDKEVPIPYILEPSRWNFSKSSGKGSPEMLYKEVFAVINQKGLQTSALTSSDIYKLMKEHRIGIDCSGFAYHLLDAYLLAEKHKSLSDVLLRFLGIKGFFEKFILQFQRFRRINAATLTSKLNCNEIINLNNIQIGDLIRMSVKKEADHVLIITNVIRDENNLIVKIEYAQSSGQNTQDRGPHLGGIQIADINKSLKDQNWLEADLNSTSYNAYYHPDKGDGIFRLKFLIN